MAAKNLQKNTMQPFVKGDIFLGLTVLNDPDDDHAGAGRIVPFTGIEKLEVNGAGGADNIYILSSPKHISVTVRGGTGDDTIHLGGDHPTLFFDPPAFTFQPPSFTVQDDPVIVYDHDIRFTDGTVLNCVRRERPQLIIVNGKVVGLLTGVYDGKVSWCQPVQVDPPY